MGHALCRLIAIALSVVAASLAAAGERESAAVESAGEWLALVDAGRYETSWQRSASLLRNAVSAAQWEQSITAARAAFGEVVSREVASAQRETSLPGAPDGEYVVIRYRTTFAKKQDALETVTPRLEDGAWKVAGYYIR